MVTEEGLEQTGLRNYQEKNARRRRKKKKKR